MQDPEERLKLASVRVKSMVKVVAIMTGATTLDGVAGRERAESTMRGWA